MIRRALRCWCVVGTALMLATPVAMADGEGVPGLGDDITPSLLTLVGAMVLIILLIYGSVWLMKRYSAGRFSGKGDLISVLERHHLSPKQAIYLLRVADKHILVGACESSITKISEIEIPIDSGTPKGPVSRRQGSTFNRVLSQARTFLTSVARTKEQHSEAEA